MTSRAAVIGRAGFALLAAWLTVITVLLVMGLRDDAAEPMEVGRVTLLQAHYRVAFEGNGSLGSVEDSFPLSEVIGDRLFPKLDRIAQVPPSGQCLLVQAELHAAANSKSRHESIFCSSRHNTVWGSDWFGTRVGAILIREDTYATAFTENWLFIVPSGQQKQTGFGGVHPVLLEYGTETRLEPVAFAANVTWTYHGSVQMYDLDDPASQDAYAEAKAGSPSG